MADPLSLAPGQEIALEDMQAVFRQHGNPNDEKGQVKSVEQVDVTDPKVKAYLLAHPEWDQQQTPFYRYHLADGTVVEAITKEDGRLQVVDYKPSATFTQRQTQANSPAAQARQGRAQIEGTPGPDGTANNERPRMVTRDATGKEVESRELTPAELKEWRENRERSRNPGNKTDAEVKTEQPTTGQDRKPLEGYPGVEVVTVVVKTPEGQQTETRFERNGEVIPDPRPATGTGSDRKPVQGKPGVYVVTTKSGTATETHYEDEQGNRVPTPTEPGKDQRESIRGKDGKPYVKVTKADPTTGKAEVYYENEQGQRVPPPSDKDDDFAVEPAGAPPVGTTVQEITRGLETYSTYLAEQVKLHKDTNGAQGIAPDQATKLMERRLKVAENVASGINTGISQANTVRGQDISQRGQTLEDTAGRRSAATSIYNTIQQQYVPLVRYAGKGGGALLAGAMQEAQNNALEYAGKWGGLRESPEIGAEQFPALAPLRQQSMGTPVAPAPSGPMIPRPVTGPPQADPAAAQAEADRQRQIAANPVFRPPPPISGDLPAAENPVSGDPITVTAPASLRPPVQDDWSTEPMAAPQPQAMMSPRFVQEARYGQSWDPEQSAADLSSRLGIEPEIMQMALDGLYG